MDRRSFLAASGAAATALAGTAACARPAAQRSPLAPEGQMQVLDGPWRLLPDPQNEGRAMRWFSAVRAGAREARVPGTAQQVFPGTYGVVWYWREFDSQVTAAPRQRALLHFHGHVDYLAEVWLNGAYLGGYEGGEAAFDLDATAALQPSGNLLAVRVLMPTNKPIDGYVLSEVPHRNKSITDDPAASWSYGGIMEPVELRIVPAVRIERVFARPDPQTGAVAATVYLINDSGQPVDARLAAGIGPANGAESAVCDAIEAAASLPPGRSEREISLRVAEPHLWDINDPYLYAIRLRLESATPGQTLVHDHRQRCGFRDFRVEGGYFRLNGRRIFLRCTHTGGRWPYTARMPGNPDLLRQDYVWMKTAGFNMVRFIAGTPTETQLDFFDELGLLVYDECLAAWMLADSPQMAERFDRNTDAMILAARNHPCVAIYGLLNETGPGYVFDHAVKYLARLRALDPTRLVLLNSGRWDVQAAVGSVSNPGSNQWEHVWGAEGPDAQSQPRDSKKHPLAYYPGAGDAHFYPAVPQGPQTDALLRSLGADTKPVFLSEYGIGSLMAATREAKRFEQIGANGGGYRAVADRLAADLAAWGMEDLYPFAEDLEADSQRLHNRQRLLGFNLVRANARLCGFSVTSLIDVGMGEGVWVESGEWKPGVMEALADGWAPLRWCLFTLPTHVYAGRPFTVEAVLANDRILAPGKYDATFKIIGPQGTAWEKRVTFDIRGDGRETPLAEPVLLEEITLPGPAGTYQFAADMIHAAPKGNRLTFHVAKPPERRAATVFGWGLSESAVGWLADQGVTARPLRELDARERSVILVGGELGEESELSRWRNLAERIAQGSAAVFLTPAVFQRSYQQLGWLPVTGKKGKVVDHFDWLYHKECLAQRHPVFAGLQSGGIMDWDVYGPVIDQRYLQGQRLPDEVLAAAVALGFPNPGGYDSGVMIASYNLGAGKFIVNTFRILENLGHPAADRLLLNLIDACAEAARGPVVALPPEWSAILESMDYLE